MRVMAMARGNGHVSSHVIAGLVCLAVVCETSSLLVDKVRTRVLTVWGVNLALASPLLTTTLLNVLPYAHRLDAAMVM